MGTARTCVFKVVKAYLSSELHGPTDSSDTFYRGIKIMVIFYLAICNECLLPDHYMPVFPE